MGHRGHLCVLKLKTNPNPNPNPNLKPNPIPNPNPNPNPKMELGEKNRWARTYCTIDSTDKEDQSKKGNHSN